MSNVSSQAPHSRTPLIEGLLAGSVFGGIVGVLVARQNVADAMTAVATAATALIAVVALVGAANQLRENRALARISAAVSLGDTMMSSEFETRVAHAKKLWFAPDPDAAYAEYQQNADLAAAVDSVWNFYENVGIQLREGYLDEKFTLAFFRETAPAHFHWSKPLIEREAAAIMARGGSSWDGFEGWDYLLRRIRSAAKGADGAMDA